MRILKKKKMKFCQTYRMRFSKKIKTSIAVSLMRGYPPNLNSPSPSPLHVLQTVHSSFFHFAYTFPFVFCILALLCFICAFYFSLCFACKLSFLCFTCMFFLLFYIQYFVLFYSCVLFVLQARLYFFCFTSKFFLFA